MLNFVHFSYICTLMHINFSFLGMYILRYCYSIISFSRFLAYSHNVRYNKMHKINKVKEDYMKKRTINRILIGIIVFLIAAICILIVQILNRPRYSAANEMETATIIEIPQSEAIPATPETQDTEEPAAQDASTQRGKTSTKVNIRELPTEDARVLETVEAGTEFDILEILDSGWTKIQYGEMEAYISSSYVILIPS